MNPESLSGFGQVGTNGGMSPAQMLGNLPVAPESRQVSHGGNYYTETTAGITLRQHYAGLFMAQMVNDPRTNGERWDWLAQQAINATTALLAALTEEAK